MKINQDTKRQTALGMFRLSLDFHESALAIERTFRRKKLFGEEAQTASFTAYYMMGHAIELVLKAVLLQRDENCHQMLKSAIGHDLEKCLEQVRKVDASILDFMDENHTHHVLVLNDNYCIKRFEYMMTGGISLPDWPTLNEFIELVQKRVAPEIPHGSRSMKTANELWY
ncbi:MAG: hypothetical protein AAF936_06350 [Pseudomonadota bacterium]